MNKLEIEIGEQIIFHKEIREVENIVRNSDNNLIVVWKTKHGGGACVPSQWLDWREGKGENY